MKRVALLLLVVVSGCRLVAGLETPSFFDEPLEAGPPDVVVPAPIVDSGQDVFIHPLSGPLCGDASCGGATPTCCLGSPSKCVANDQPCATPIACDGPEDCATGVCCIGNELFSDAGARCIAPDASCSGFASGFACHEKAECAGNKECDFFSFAPFQRSQYRTCR